MLICTSMFTTVYHHICDIILGHDWTRLTCSVEPATKASFIYQSLTYSGHFTRCVTSTDECILIHTLHSINSTRGRWIVSSAMARTCVSSSLHGAAEYRCPSACTNWRLHVSLWLSSPWHGVIFTNPRTMLTANNFQLIIFSWTISRS